MLGLKIECGIVNTSCYVYIIMTKFIQYTGTFDIHVSFPFLSSLLWSSIQSNHLIQFLGLLEFATNDLFTRQGFSFQNIVMKDNIMRELLLVIPFLSGSIVIIVVNDNNFRSR